MTKQHALNQLRLMQAWHEDNGDGPNADYDAICFAIEAIERSEELEKLITALETEHAKMREMQSATDTNVGDTISRQAVKEMMENHRVDFSTEKDYRTARVCVNAVPPAQQNLSEEYAKAVRNWLVNYQIKCAELNGRYTPYEVLGWIVSDWRKENGIW